MPTRVPPRTAAIGRRSSRRPRRRPRNYRPARAGGRSPRGTSCASSPRRIRRPEPAISARSSVARAIYSSTLCDWRRQRDAGAFGALTPARRGPKVSRTQPVRRGSGLAAEEQRPSHATPCPRGGHHRHPKKSCGSAGHPAGVRTATCLDRSRRGACAGPWPDRCCLLRARGFARQRASGPRGLAAPPTIPRPRPRPARALTAPQQQAVLDLLHASRFADQAPAEIYATLLDEGVYHCSIRTMYRILARSERRNPRTPSTAAPSDLSKARTSGGKAKRGLVLGHHQTDGASQMALLLSLRHPRHLQPSGGRLVRCGGRKRLAVSAVARGRDRRNTMCCPASSRCTPIAAVR